MANCIELPWRCLADIPIGCIILVVAILQHLIQWMKSTKKHILSVYVYASCVSNKVVGNYLG